MIRKTIKGGDFKPQMVGELEFDQVPEEGSFNPVTSDGVDKAIDEAKEYMQEKINEVTLDPSAVAFSNVHLLDKVTEFAADSGILVDSKTNGPGFMDASKLLELTAQNALANNVALEFDPTRTSEDPYLVGQRVIYGGQLKVFTNNHYGAWADGDVRNATVDEWLNIIDSCIELRHSINLFDNDFDESGYIKVADGTDASSGDYKRTSKYYDVGDYQATLYYLATVSAPTMIFCFYAADKSYIGYTSANNFTLGTVSVPTTTKYFRLYTQSVYSGSVCLSKVQTTVYVPYEVNYYLKAKLEVSSVGVGNLDKTILDSENLVEVIFDRSYLNYSNGSVTANVDGYRSVDYIEVNPSTDYVFGAYNESNSPTTEINAMSIAFYDSSKNFISASGCYSSGNTHTNCSWYKGLMLVTSPATAKYARLGLNDLSSPNKLKFAKKADVLFTDSNAIKQNNVNLNILLQGKEIACFGDSIIGNTRDTTSTPANIAKACGATVHNFGFGGCRMSVHAAGWDNCSMYRLADDIYAGDFSSLVTAINTGWSGMPGYFKNTVAWLAALDFDTIDAIVISYGTNDYREETSTLDNPSDKFDTSTVCGALRYSIKKIQESHPKIQILVTCPIFRMFLDSNNDVTEDSDTKDWGSGTLLEYASAYEQVCKEMKVQYLDLYNTCGLCINTRSYFYPNDDGTHPNENGRKRLGELIAGKIKSML